MTTYNYSGIIRAGTFAGAIIAISTVVGFAYEANAWSADLEKLNVEQRSNMLGMEKRMLTRQIMQWRTKPTVSVQEKHYKEAMVKQLESDKNDVSEKMRALDQ